MAKISIIVPIYNSELYIDKCVQSLINQTLDDIEIILIDDCSTDNSKEKIEEYYNLYKNKIVPIYLSKNQKQGAARNKGIEVATGEYILFVDSDDYIDLSTCELTYNKAKNGNFDIVCFDAMEVYKDRMNSIKLNYDYKIEGKIDSQIRRKITDSRGFFWTRLYKRDMLIKNNIVFPENIFYEDSPFNFITLLSASNIAKIDKELYYYTQREGSSSNCRNENRLYDRINTLEFMFQEVNKKNIYEINKEYIDRKYLKMSVGNIHLCLDMFDKVNIDRMKEIALNLNKNITNWRNRDEYKELDKVSKIYLNLNDKCPRFLVFLDRIYKKIV